MGTDTSSKVTSMVMVTTHGAMIVSTRVSGVEIRCMEKAFSLGVTAKSMKDLMSMIKNLATVFLSGLVGVCTMVNGWRVSNMGQARTLPLMVVSSALVSGIMGVKL